MFDFTDTITAAPSKAFQELRSFAGENADTLACAAALLGASPGVRNALSALDGLANQGRPTARTMRALDDLVDLLTLKNVHEPHRIEAACFSASSQMASLTPLEHTARTRASRWPLEWQHEWVAHAIPLRRPG